MSTSDGHRKWNRSSWTQGLRLIIGLAALSVAWLAVVPAPNGTLWMVAIAATEWGHWIALFALLPLFPGWRGSKVGTLGAAAALIAVVLSIYPIYSAFLTARNLPADLDSAFGSTQAKTAADAPARSSPFATLDLFRGVRSPNVSVQALSYAQKVDQNLQLDLYRNERQSGRQPLVIVIHGGSWQRYDRTQLSPLNSYLAARGYVVASIDYRLSPQFRFPAARDDVSSAISFLKENHEKLGIDPEKIVLLGRSAGGQLALLVGYADHDSAIRGVVAFYGMNDLAYIYANPADLDVIDSRDILRAHIGGTPDELPDLYRDATPVSFIDGSSPPTLLIHGGRDELFPWALSERVDAKLQENGVAHYFVRLPWATHACDFVFSGPCGQVSTYAVERFLASVTR